MTTAAIVVTVAAATASWSDIVKYNAGTVTVWQIMRTQTVGEQDGHCEYTISVSAHNNAGRYFPCGDMQVTRRPAGGYTCAGNIKPNFVVGTADLSDVISALAVAMANERDKLNLTDK